MEWLTFGFAVKALLIIAAGVGGVWAIKHENAGDGKKLGTAIVIAMLGVIASMLNALYSEAENAQNEVKAASDFKTTLDSLQLIAVDLRRANDSIKVQLREGRSQFKASYVAFSSITDSLREVAADIKMNMKYSSKIKKDVTTIAYPISTMYFYVTLGFDLDTAQIPTIVSKVAEHYPENTAVFAQNTPQSLVDFQNELPDLNHYLLGIMAKLDCFDRNGRQRAQYHSGYRYGEGNKLLNMYRLGQQLIVELKMTLKDPIDDFPDMSYEDAVKKNMIFTVGAGQVEQPYYAIPWHLQDLRVAMRNEDAVEIKAMEKNEWIGGANLAWRIAQR